MENLREYNIVMKDLMAILTVGANGINCCNYPHNQERLREERNGDFLSNVFLK